MDRGISITAADNGERAGIGDSLRHGECAFTESFKFEHTHRPVPDNRFDVFEGIGKD